MIEQSKTKRPVISEAMTLAEYEDLSTAEKLQYERDKRRAHDEVLIHNYALREAREQGLEEGRFEGIEQGIEQGAISEKHSLVERMLIEGLDVSLISKITGLAVEDICRLGASGDSES